MKNWKDIALLTITLICLVLLFFIPKCEPVKVDLKPKSDTVTIVTNKIDTIWPDPKVIHDLKIVKVPEPRVDTFFKPIYMDSASCNRIYVYEDSLSDSNLVWRYKAYTQGILRDLKSNYSLKIPIRIIDSIKIKETIKIHPKFTLYGTLAISKGIIAPMGEIGLKRLKIGLGYNLINQTLVGSISYKLIEK